MRENGTFSSSMRGAINSGKMKSDLLSYMLDHYSVGFVWHDETIKKEKMGSPNGS